MITEENWGFIKKHLKPSKGAELICLGFPDSTFTENFYDQFSGYFAKSTVLDAIAHKGFERVVDLNKWEPDITADVVLDSGTLEHCMNIGRAFRTAAEMVREGGLLFLTGPVAMLNHGYWSYNPSVIYDGLGENGFEILDYVLAPFPRQFQVKASEDRAFLPAQEFTQFMVAKRTHKAGAWTWPIQKKYRS